MASIEIVNATVGYGSRTIIDDQSIRIPEGSFFTMLGPSGCGKTTFLRLIAGFIEPRPGRILFGGRDVTHTPAHRRNCGVVFQDYALFPDRTVFENVAYGLRARGIGDSDIRRRVGRYLERVELADFAARLPANLSGGQRQRVALARALAIEPQVLLLDEPLSALDAKLAIEMQSFVRDIQREFGVTTVFVTHDQRMALTMSDQIALLRDGRVEQIDTPRAIYHRPRSTYAADFIGAANLVVPDSTVVEGEAAYCTIGDTTVRVHRNGCTATEGAKLCIREESLRVLPPGQDGHEPSNLLKAQVERVIFMGEAFRFDLRLANGIPLKVVQQSGFDAFVPEAGTEIRVHLSPDSCLVRDNGA